MIDESVRMDGMFGSWYGGLLKSGRLESRVNVFDEENEQG
jgi:hypothetical protein